MQAMNRFAWCLDALSTIRALPPIVIADETLDLLLPRAAHAHFDDAPAWRTFLGRVVHPALAVAPTVEPR